MDRLGRARPRPPSSGIDTLWGGDVMNPSGTGALHRRLLVLGRAAAGGLHAPDGAEGARKRGRLGAKSRTAAAIDAYLAAVDVKGAIDAMAVGERQARAVCAARLLRGARECFRRCGTSSRRLLGRGPACPTSAASSARRESRPSRRAGEKRHRVASCSRRPAIPRRSGDELLAAVDAWRRERIVPAKSIAMLADAFIAQFDAGTSQAPGAAPAAGPSRRAARQHEVPADRGRLVLRLDELHRAARASPTARPSTRRPTRSTRRSRSACPSSRSSSPTRSCRAT